MNPFSGAQLVLKNGDPIENFRRKGSNMAALSSSTGEFNANGRQDLVMAIQALHQAIIGGDVVPVQQSALANSSEFKAQAAAEREAKREIMIQAYSDPAKWTALGASIAARVEEMRNRQGFLRVLALGNTLRQGEIARVAMTAWDAVAIVATSAAEVGYQVIRNKVFQPAEFEITANLRAEALEIEQVSGDLLDSLYDQGLDSIMVQEDRIWKNAADKAVGVVNPLEYISGSLTPALLTRIRDSVSEHNLPATNCVMAVDFWSDVIGNSEFHEFLDPVSRYDLVMNGKMGTLVGLNLITDAYRQPNQKVLNKGEIYVVASPENHAAYTDRGGVRSTPTSGADQGSTSKGWLLSEMFSFVLANGRSVAKGQRV